MKIGKGGFCRERKKNGLLVILNVVVWQEPSGNVEGS